jgi:hypothetical protein
MQNDPYFGDLYAACHYFTRASVLTGRFCHPPSRNPRQTKSGERIQGPDMSRRSRTLPAVTPGVGLTSTRHVRDTVESTPPGKCSVEVEERTRGSRMPGTRMRYARDMRFARLRMQGRNPFLLQFCAAGAFLLSAPFGPSGCLYVF